MLQNLSVPKKLVLSFAAVIAACGVATLVVLWAVLGIHKAQQEDIIAQDISAAINTVHVSLLNEQMNMRGYILTLKPEFRETFNQQAENYRAGVADMAAADVHGRFAEEIEQLRTIGEAATNDLIGMMDLGANPEHRAEAMGRLSIKGSPQMQELTRVGRQALTDIAEMREQIAAKREFAYKKAFIAFGVGGSLAFAIAIASAIWLTNALSKPVVAMTRAMDRLAHGDLDVAIPAVGRKDEVGNMATAVLTFKDQAVQNRRLEVEAIASREAAEEIRRKHEAETAEMARLDQIAVSAVGEGLSALANGNLAHRINIAVHDKAQPLKDDFNAAATKLESAVTIIIDRASAIGAAAEQISEASDDLSRRTEQQAASLEETAAAVEQISSTVQASAQASEETGNVVRQAHDRAGDGRQVVQRAVAAMGEIERSSNQIGDIISVIDEIAFQTNLLALNAGVEAARAGDAGRGFAVVASEVRALAQRSAEAAKEIKTLINASGQHVGQGVSLVSQTDEALAGISDFIGRVRELAGASEAAAREQATGLAEVNMAVTQMDQVTQQNAAMVEEATAASRSLAQDAAELDRLMRQFQINRQALLANAI